MRVTTRFAVIALCTLSLAALPSRADDSPSAQLVGYRCELVTLGDASLDLGVVAIFVCQIEDGPGPFGPDPLRAPSGGVVIPTLEYALKLFPLPQHEPIEATTPTP